MDPYRGYFYQPFTPEEGQWYNEYFRNQQYYHYYQTQAYNYATRPFISSDQFYHQNMIRRPETIKIEDDSHERPKSVEEVRARRGRPRSFKVPKSKPVVAEVMKKSYAHPPKAVKHKVKYFDPSSCPPVTSGDYNLVLDQSLEKQRTNLLGLMESKQVNQLKHPQKDQEPFICYRFRRIKKKFKKYVKCNQQFVLSESNQDSENSDSEDLDSQSKQNQDKSNSESCRIQENKTKKKKAGQVERQENEKQGRRYRRLHE